MKKTVIIFNGFIHDFAAGIWLAAIATITLLHNAHVREQTLIKIVNQIEQRFFWASIVAMVFIMATGAGRTFTYVENWYGEDAERMRRRMLIIKHLALLICFGAGYLWVWGRAFHS